MRPTKKVRNYKSLTSSIVKPVMSAIIDLEGLRDRYIGSLQYIGLLFRVDVPVPMILIHKRTPRQPAEGDGVVPNHRAHALRYVMSPLTGLIHPLRNFNFLIL